MTRNRLLFLFLMLIGLSLPFSVSAKESSVESAPARLSSSDALAQLQQGNERFASARPQTLLQKHKQPYAAVVACSEASVPVETIFNAGVHDLFVVQTAGNICDTSTVASIEYSLTHIKTPLLVVLGHTDCGILKRVIRSIEKKENLFSEKSMPIAEKILPAVKKSMRTATPATRRDFIASVTEENVWQTITELLEESAAARRLLKEEELLVRGAVYDAETGTVEWLDTNKPAAILARLESGRKGQKNENRSGGSKAAEKKAGQGEERAEKKNVRAPLERLEAKIEELISQFEAIDIAISKPARFYAKTITRYREENASFAEEPLGIQLKAAAILHRDFDNGEDPEKLIALITKEYKEMV